MITKMIAPKRVHKTFYHLTRSENIESILDEGLIPQKRRSGFTKGRKLKGVWLEATLDGVATSVNKLGLARSGTTSVISVDSSYLNRSQLKRNPKAPFWIYYGTIHPEALSYEGEIKIVS